MILTDAINTYLEALTPPPDPVLAEMEAHAAREHVPVVPRVTGQLLHVLALACGARRVLEVGTAIGVSTLYLARALPPDGVIVSFDVDERRQTAARNYLTRAGLGDRVDLRLQDARDGLRSEPGIFDMAFVDGSKVQYGDYFEALLPRLRFGAVLTVDNVLMSGTVAQGRGDGNWTQDQVDFVRDFTRRLLNHPQLTGTVTPVGDGLAVAVKR